MAFSDNLWQDFYVYINFLLEIDITKNFKYIMFERVSRKGY
jgi:hypothetical protein